MNIPTSSVFYPISSLNISFYDYYGVMGSPLVVLYYAETNPPASISHPEGRRLQGVTDINLNLQKLTQCSIGVCLKTYNTSITNGVPLIKTISEDDGVTDYIVNKLSC